MLDILDRETNPIFECYLCMPREIWKENSEDHVKLISSMEIGTLGNI